MKHNFDQLFFNLFLLSIFFFKIPSFYILPFFKSVFTTSQSLARILIVFIFFYNLCFKKNRIKIINKNKIIILLTIFFFIQSLSVISVVNLNAFYLRYKDVIVSFLVFFISYFYKDRYKKIINVFIISLVINFSYQFLIIYLPHFSLDLLANIIYDKHFDLVLAKLSQGKVYLDAYDEITIPFLLLNLSIQNFVFLISNIFFSLFSNIRSRVLMLISAIFFSLFILRKKIDKKRAFLFLFIFLIFAYLINNLMISRLGFSYLTRFLLEEEIDISPINFRQDQLKNAFLLAKGNFLGVGLGNYFDNISSLEKNKYILVTSFQKITHIGAQESVHNIFGLILSETGFIGLFVFLLVMVEFVKQDLALLKKRSTTYQKTLIVAFWSLFLYGLFNPIVPGSYQVLFWGIRGILL